MISTRSASRIIVVALMAASGLAGAQAVLQTPTGRGTIKLTNLDSVFFARATSCLVKSADAVPASSLGMAAPGPAGVALPYGALRVSLDNCATAPAPIEGLPPPWPPPVQLIRLELEEAPDPATVAFAFGPTAETPTPHWYELRTTVVGKLVQFDIEDGALGDDETAGDRTIKSLVALGVPKYAAVDGTFRDLWWGGPQENGWGLSIDQHRDVLFGVLFIYDGDGMPRWLVMPGGEWNGARTTYTGNLYSTRGSPNHANLPATFVPGPPIGVLALTPSSRDTMVLQYTVNGISGTKEIRRQSFGPFNPEPVAGFGDLWWGGVEQSGWGFALAQQYQSYFGVVYTYDHDGSPIWFVAPSLARPETSSITKGPIYRTSGSPWIGTAYDPSKLVATEVGTMSFIFDDPRSGQLALDIQGRILFPQRIYRQPF